MKIVIIRHAEPNYEKNTLTEKGFKEAEILGKYLSANDFDEIYTSPYGRAKLTEEAVIKGKKNVFVVDWLKEFGHNVKVDGKEVLNWDFYPDYLDTQEGIYDYSKYLETELMKSGDMKKYIDEVYSELDKVLSKHGITKYKSYFKVEKSSKETIVFFCHLGIMSVILSYLINIPYVSLIQGFCCLPSGVTTVVTEERKKGIASFRVLNYGDTSHLRRENEKESFMGRFCETFDSEERH